MTASASYRHKVALLQYIHNNPDRLFQVGPISGWVGGGLSFERTEMLLTSLVAENILRYATKEELQAAGLKHGYKLTSLEMLPPIDDRVF